LASTGVRINLGVEHQDVDVAAGGDHMVEPAEADVIGPAIPTDDPDALIDQMVGDLNQRGGIEVRLAG
jgi:hypothetical protein